MDNKTKDALKQLQAEMRQLQARLAEPKPDDARPEPEPPKKDKPGREAVVQYAVHYGAALDTGLVGLSAAQLEQVTDEAAATLGYALSSPQKVGLLRALLAGEAETAAALGAATSLSTGSLYHHLRDLMHAGLIRQESRNRYLLSERGLRVLLLMLALAAE